MEQTHGHSMYNKTVSSYSIVPIKRTVFFSTVTVGKNTVRLIGTIEYIPTKTTFLTILQHIYDIFHYLEDLCPQDSW